MYKHHAMQGLRLAIVLTALLCTCIIIYYSFSFIYPILLAFVLSYILHPFVSIMEQKLKLPRPVATFFVMAAMLLSLSAFLIAAITEIYQSTIFLAEKVPHHFQSFIRNLEEFFYAHIMPVYENILSFFYALDQDHQAAIQGHVDMLMANAVTSLTAMLQNMLLSIPALFSVLPNSITVILFILLATFIITNDWNKLKQTANKLLSQQIHSRISVILHHLKKALGGYFKAQLILISITFILIFFGLQLIGIDHALTIAFLSSLIDLIPYLGIGVVFIPWIIYVFLQANYKLTIALCLLYMLIAITRQVLEPKILSANIGVNPLGALIAMFLGLQLWGFFGLLLAPIILIVISAFHQAGVTKWIWSYVTK